MFVFWFRALRPAVPSRRACERVGLVALMLGLAGCATFSKDGGFDTVSTTASDRLGRHVAFARNDAERADLRLEIDALLANPLTADDAVQVAVLNNPDLQGVYAELGIAEADLVRAGRLPNPRFSTTRTTSDSSFKYESALTIPILALVTMPTTLKMERGRFEAVKLQVTDRILRLAAEVREAWTDAVAADEALRYRRQVALAADAGAELAGRMVAAGNFSALDRMREEVFSADAATQRIRAEASVATAREKLARLLGLEAGAAAFRLPERLPDLPPIAASYEALEAFALAQRLDVQAAKLDAAATARSLGLVRATRFIDALELGPATLLEKDEATRKGFTLSVEVPLFDWGDSKVRRAESIYLRSVSRVTATALDARSQVRSAYARYNSAWQVAQHYRDTIVPLRRRISEENVLRYNGMLLSVFELLADAREQIAAASGYIESNRDYWLAEAGLRAALGGKLPAPSLAVSSTPASTPAAPPAAPAAPHHQHSKE